MGVTSTFRHGPGEAVPYFEKYLKLRPQDPRGKLALGTPFPAKDYDAAVFHGWRKQPGYRNRDDGPLLLGAIALQERRLDEAHNELELA